MQTPAYINDVTVIIRSVGERTEASCRYLLAQQIPEDHIITVSNAPFSATLADSYRVGIERGLPWTLCIDSDVLVRSYTVSELLNVAYELPKEVFEVQGMVLDKFFGVSRPAGNHLYRTSLLPRALDLIPREGKDLRPEYYTVKRMAELGYPWVETPLVLGLHDFEQYYKDIFRKCYVHAHKHSQQMHLLVEYWRRGRMTSQADDYRVALWGLSAGIADCSNVHVDVRHNYGFSKWMQAEELVEKQALEACQITPEWVEQTLTEWEAPGGELERTASCYTKAIIHGGRPPRPESRGMRLKKMKKELGITMMAPWLAGWSLNWAGRKLMDMVNNSRE
jgi:hypothetical protein